MGTSDWRRVEEIVHAALERSPGERVTFVRDTCGSDDTLRSEVESLLANASAVDQSILKSGNLGVALIGRQIGVYRVEALLGVGGMGEVYRARDARLQRDVAIKVLPADVAADPDRLARFQREARVLASLPTARWLAPSHRATPSTSDRHFHPTASGLPLCRTGAVSGASGS